MKFNKKYLYALLFIFTIIVASGVIIYLELTKKNINHVVEIVLNEPQNQEIEVNGKYEELGATLFIDGEFSANDLQIDTSELNLDVLGEYNVKYYTVIDDKEYSKYRLVKVIDNKAPVINLVGKDVTIVVSDEYEEPGYEAVDNYDSGEAENIFEFLKDYQKDSAVENRRSYE